LAEDEIHVQPLGFRDGRSGAEPDTRQLNKRLTRHELRPIYLRQ
jgi:hypothetical protein